MSGAVRIIFRRFDQETLHRVLPDVILKLLVFERISDPPIQEARLPNFSLKFQAFVELKRESTLHELHCSFQSDSGWRQDQVNVVRHDDKFMQSIFLLCSVIQQDFHEEARNLVNLKQASLLRNIGGNKVGGLGGHTAMRNGQRSPQRLKPPDYSRLTAGLKACSTS